MDGAHSAPLSELLTPSFIAKHTRFANVEEMFDASGFRIESEEDFAAVPTEQMDKFVRSVSSFPTWQAMLEDAAKLWATRKLGL